MRPGRRSAPAGVRRPSRGAPGSTRARWNATSPPPARVEMVRGRGLLDVARSLADLPALVCNDSGLMHLAEAVGTPVTGLLRPHGARLRLCAGAPAGQPPARADGTSTADPARATASAPATAATSPASPRITPDEPGRPGRPADMGAVLTAYRAVSPLAAALTPPPRPPPTPSCAWAWTGAAAWRRAWLRRAEGLSGASGSTRQRRRVPAGPARHRRDASEPWATRPLPSRSPISRPAATSIAAGGPWPSPRLPAAGHAGRHGRASTAWRPRAPGLREVRRVAQPGAGGRNDAGVPHGAHGRLAGAGSGRLRWPGPERSTATSSTASRTSA
jgi:hypothetical protein